MAISLVQSAKNNSGASSVVTLNATLGSSPTAGNLLVAAAAVVGTSSSPSAAALFSSSGVTWIEIPCTQAGSGMTLLLAVGRIFSGASTTITATTVVSGGIAMVVSEFSGVGQSWDQLVAAIGNSTTGASGTSGTTSVADELAIFACGHRVSGGATFSSQTDGFTAIDQDKTSLATTNDRSVYLAYKVLSATGTVNPAITISASGVWVAQAATFQVPAAAGGGSANLLNGKL